MINFPSSNDIETGPKVLESREYGALSPTIQMWPFGTTMCSVDGAVSPVGSTQTISPGSPRTRLPMMLSGMMGLLSTTRSPRAIRYGKSLKVRRSSITISPVSASVGNMEGPSICDVTPSVARLEG